LQGVAFPSTAQRLTQLCTIMHVQRGDYMAMIGLAEAAKLTGRNQSTVHWVMQKGRLSYSVGENGERRIDTAELDGAFGVKPNGGGNAMPDAMAGPLQSYATHAVEIAALRQQLDDRGEMIRDLRARLDASEAERRAVAAQLAASLAPPVRRWWRRASG
jgi:hypothetical protein